MSCSIHFLQVQGCKIIELGCFHMSTKTDGRFWLKRTGQCGVWPHRDMCTCSGVFSWIELLGPCQMIASSLLPWLLPMQPPLESQDSWLGSLYPTLLSGIKPTLLWPHDLVLASPSISFHPAGSGDHVFPAAEGGSFWFLGQSSHAASFFFGLGIVRPAVPVPGMFFHEHFATKGSLLSFRLSWNISSLENPLWPPCPKSHSSPHSSPSSILFISSAVFDPHWGYSPYVLTVLSLLILVTQGGARHVESAQ